MQIEIVKPFTGSVLTGNGGLIIPAIVAKAGDDAWPESYIIKHCHVTHYWLTYSEE